MSTKVNIIRRLRILLLTKTLTIFNLSVFVISNFVIVTVIVDNTRISPNKWNVEEGDSVKFSCDSHGTALWFFNEQLIPSNAVIHTLNNSITITNVSVYNSGLYQCLGFVQYLSFYAEGEVEVHGEI